MLDLERRQTAIRDLCSRFFSDPARLTDCLGHPIEGTFEFAPHSHRGLLQFDLLDGCAGEVWREGRWTPVRGVTAVVSYPGEEHGYRLQAERSPSRIHHVKLQVQRSWPAIEARIFPPLITGFARQPVLTDCLQAVMQLGVVQRIRSPLLLARLSEMIALWPLGRDAGETYLTGAPATDAIGEEDALAEALRLIQRRLADPPGLDELARAAHLSPRHFVRRFRMRFGCTPHAHMTALRLDRARQLLLAQRLGVSRIADTLGFSSAATFSRWFHQHTGVPPTEYRKSPTAL